MSIDAINTNPIYMCKMSVCVVELELFTKLAKICCNMTRMIRTQAGRVLTSFLTVKELPGWLEIIGGLWITGESP